VTNRTHPGHFTCTVLGLLLLVACASCGSESESTQPQVLADDIPVAHTPPGGYGATFPAPILAGCTEPLVADAADLRGTWEVVEVERDGQPAPPTDPAYAHTERIEQCGNRVVVTGGGVIHDMRCDGTAEHGVNDVSAPTGQPIQVVCTFENRVHVLRPVGIPGVEVTRQLDGDVMVWHYVDFVARLQRIDDHMATLLRGRGQGTNAPVT